MEMDGIKIILKNEEAERTYEELRKRLSPLKAAILANRGIKNLPGAKIPLPDPESVLPGVREAAKTFDEWMRNHPKEVLIHHDFDCDGITGASILVKFCEKKYGEVPKTACNRREEGYSFTPEIAEKFFEEGYRKIITVDKGIADKEGVARFKELGGDIIVTDHHEPQGEPPKADHVVCWTVNGGAKLCGAATAFWLARAVDEKTANPFVDMAGMATMVDMVPLSDPVNRVLVMKAYERMKRGIYSSTKWRTFLEQIGITRSNLSYDSFGYKAGPIINTAGRNNLGNRFVEEMRGEGFFSPFFSKRLIALNEERKNMVFDASINLDDYVFWENERVVFYLIDDTEFIHKNYSGLVATIKGTDDGKVTFIGFLEDGNVKGSARSGRTDFDLQKIFGKRYEECLVRGGGHRAACGFEIPEEKLERFFEILSEESVDLEEKREEITFESPKLLTEEIISEINSLEPFGVGFEPPHVGVKDDPSLKTSVRVLKGKHLKIGYVDIPVEIMLFNVKNASEIAKEVRDLRRKGETLLFGGNLSFNDFGKERKISLVLDAPIRISGGIEREKDALERAP